VTSIRERLDAGGVTFGAWCGLSSTFTTELVARAGFDWICIDTQHGLIGFQELAGMLQVSTAVGTPALVRVASHEASELMHALDAGAEGVVVPMVDTAEQARALVDACRYPPAGHRSWGPIRGAFGNRMPGIEAANRTTIVVLMIETVAGVENVGEIAAVPGVDALLVGPSDIAVVHGLAADPDVRTPEHARLVRRVVDAARSHGIVSGLVCGSMDTAHRWAEEGMRLLNVGSELSWMASGARSQVEEAHRLLGWG
jgi:4-hydroxy-2-oxoheptanedioate aldolase